MKLSTKLLLSYFAVAFLVLLVGSGSYFLNKNIKDNLINESQNSITEIQRLSDLGFYLQNSLLYTRNFLIERNIERQTDVGEMQFKSLTAEQTVRSDLNQISGIMETMRDEEPGNSFSNVDLQNSYNRIDQLADSLETGFQLYRSLIYELFELEAEGYGEEVFDLTVEPYFRTTLLPVMEELRDIQAERVELQLEELQSQAERTAQIIGLITGIAFLIASWLAYFMRLTIMRPIANLSQATEEIGAGNLDKRIQIGTNDELERLGDSFNRMAENLNKSMVSREYVNNIIQSMGDMLMVTDPDYTIQLVNKTSINTLGYSEEELIEKNMWSLFGDNFVNEIEKKISAAKQSGSFENRFKTKRGEYIPVIISYSTLSGRNDEVSGIVFVASNITSQKEAEDKINKSLKEKEVLLAEIHHRVKNNLAVISGLLEMQIWNLQDEGASVVALKESQLRIQSIALVHELLYQSETLAEIKFDEYTLKLLSAIEKTHKQNDKSITVTTDLAPVRVTIQKAIPASLLLNEIVVNSYKHAFKGRTSGTITVKIGQGNGLIRLHVNDDGVGLPSDFDPFKQKTLGMTLIKTLVQQMDAEFSVGPNDNNSGTSIAISFKEELS